MRGEKREHWMNLCAQAAEEQDPAKLMKLIAEIDRMLTEKQDRLKALRSGAKSVQERPSEPTGAADESI